MTPFNLYWRPVETDRDWEALRSIRNQCAQFMTGFQGEITPEMQRVFRDAVAVCPQNHRLWLAYEGDVIPTPVGFVYVRKEDGLYWVTYGMIERLRDQGYGRQLVDFTKYHANVLWLRVLKSNARARRVYEREGFIVVSEGEDFVTMTWRGE